uniref:Uncharacterized protein n=1 Tax=viral metagenome TaxID=1070528 RepID=A0A6M3ME27_9ZZZZ
MIPEKRKGASREGDPPGFDRCRICGHPIWTDESVKRGVGPVCWGRIKRGEIEDRGV